MTKEFASRYGLERHTRVFISCANEDLAEAKFYRKSLEDVGFTVHLFVENYFGTPIEKVVRSQIVACDFFLLLVSKYSSSLDRPWVARELGLALATRASNGGYRPMVIPIYAQPDDDDPGRIVEFPVRDFDTSDLSDERFDLSELRGHDPHRNAAADTLKQLIRSMQIEIALVREDITTEEELQETGAIKLYHELFPDDQRAPLDHDLRWIFRTDIDKPFRLSIATSKWMPRLLTWVGVRGTYRLKSYFFVLLRCGRAIGFAWVTYHRKSRLLYGNYIGVQEQWRRGSMVNPLMDRVQERVLQDFPKCRGLVLEVEPFSLDEVEAAVETLERGAESDAARRRAIDVVRSFKRVWWYETCNRLEAKCIRDADTRVPLGHVYPCMEPDAPRREWPQYEVPYWLLISTPESVRRTDKRENAWALWRRATDFSVLENMAKRVLRDRPEKADEYWDYVLALQRRNVRTAVEGTGRNVEFAPVFGAERGRGRRANRLYARIARLPIQINV